MKQHNLKFILLAFGVVFFSSCTQLLYTSLDVLRPAKVEFKTDANDLLIVNNTVVQPQNYGHKTILMNNKSTNVLIASDSLAIFCLSSLAEDIENKAFFNSVQVLPNSVNTSFEFFGPNKLSDDTTRMLCKSNQTNVILSLDNIKVNDDLNEYYLEDNYSFLNSLEVKYETTWSIHYPDILDVKTISFKDTLYWETQSDDRRKAQSDMPNREDALIDGALEVGRKCVNRFTPYWEKVDRYFFTSGNKNIKQGMDSVYVKNWKSAIEIWTSIYNKTNNCLVQAYAANNIAIANEISGNIDKALEFATKSYYSFGKLTIPDYSSFIRVLDYVNELNQRKKEIKILKKQLGE
ncbi:MAG: DUF6340 family protein [Paludibacter sp.]